MIFDFLSGGLFNHYALERDIALRGDGLECQKEVRQSLETTMTNDKRDFDLPGLFALRFLKADWPISERPPHNHSAKGGKNTCNVQVRSPLPVTLDSQSVRGRD